MARNKPNIVYILADDMGYGDLSCLNERAGFRAPHLDRLASDGMIFRDAHASSALCTPSRYSILTGRYCWRSRLKRSVLQGYSQRLIEPDRLTVPAFLKSHGYITGCVGKWHLGWTWPLNNGDPEDVDFTRPIEDGPTSVGFDYFFGISASLDMPPYVYVENDTPTAVPDRIIGDSPGKQLWREGPIAPDFAHAEVNGKFTEKAVAFIEEKAAGDAPFFLYLPLAAPHTPILPAPAFQGASGTNDYGDFCLEVDDTVGRVMKVLEEMGKRDDTVLIFAADNGCAPQADYEELAQFGHNPSYVFRGSKADIYEGGHRIPLVVSWPLGVEPGSATDQTVCLSDLLATCADIIGDELPDGAGEDSVSNLAVWQGKAESPLRDATVHQSGDGSLSIRQGKWKLEMCPGSGGWSHPKPGKECEGLSPIQLYDLSADIGERENVQEEYPEVVERLRDLLTEYVCNGRSTPGSRRENHGGCSWEQLWWMKEQNQ